MVYKTWPCCKHCPADCKGNHAGPCFDCKMDRCEKTDLLVDQCACPSCRPELSKPEKMTPKEFMEDL